MKLRYAVVFEQTRNNYCAYAPDVPGCISTGKNWLHMQMMIREALTVHIESMLEDGEPVPEQRMSIEGAMADYIEPLTEDEQASYAKFGEAEPALSVTFQMVEIDVQVDEPIDNHELTAHTLHSLGKVAFPSDNR